MKKENAMLEAARSLHQMGLALIWLHPKEKRPIESGWTTGPRNSFAALDASYASGNNLGVRLGGASRLGTGYLAAIDVDIKNADPAAREEAEAALTALIGFVDLPTVTTGRGNGSRHLYCLTSAPFKTWNPAERAGAWQISLYSSGRQCVLPPSLHPSGRRYAWAGARPNLDAFPLLRLPEAPAKAAAKPGRGPAAGAPSGAEAGAAGVDIRWLAVDEETRRLIVDGVWRGAPIADRSNYILPAATGLVSAGLDAAEVLSVLTDPTTVLGGCAYDHVGGQGREAARRWLWRYGVERVFAERSAKAVFAASPLPKSVGAAAAGEGVDDDPPHPRETGYYVAGKAGKMSPAYDALLEDFEEEHPYRFIAEMKTVYVWEAGYYRDFSTPEVKQYAENHFMPKPDEKTRNEFLSKVMANHVERQGWFASSTEGWLNFRNGLFNVERGERREPAPDYGFRGQLPYAYEPAARCPRFEKWLDGVMQGDRELVDVLQEYMGYVVRGGEYLHHKALWLEGTGRNGKSTFIDVVKALIGREQYSSVSIKTLIEDRFAGEMLDGKLANFSEETSPEELRDSGPFKNLTGDGEIFAQKKWGSPYLFRNRAKLIMTYNQVPDLKDLSVGMLSRPLIVPFRRRFAEGEQDKSIKAKLLSELPGIFNFALAGWKRLETQGEFTAAKASAAALSKVRHESCPVFQWVEHCVEETGDTSMVKKPREMYAAYSQHERGRQFRMSEFFRRLNTHPLIRGHRRRVASGTVYWGIQAI